MKKVSLVVMKKDYEASLKKLREAGVVHLKKKKGSSALLSQLFERLTKVRWTLSYLARYKVDDDHPEVTTDYIVPADETLHIQGLLSEKHNLQEQFSHFMGEKQRVKQFGDFDPHDFTFLSQHDIKLFLYYLPRIIYNRIGDGAKLIVFGSEGQWIKAVAVGAEVPGIQSFKLPAMSMSAMDNRISVINRRLAKIESELINLAYHKQNIVAEEHRLLEEIEYETAKAGMETLEEAPPEYAVSWLTGFVPSEDLELLKRTAIENNWALVADDPGAEDAPPTKLRANPFVRIIHPVLSFLGTVPGYREFDISFSYLVFFSIFFAMILGDAGYGALLFSVALILGFVTKKKSGTFPDVVKLLMVLTGCTVVWGSITGAWFQIPRAHLPPVLAALIIPPFNGVGPVVEFPAFLQNVFKLPAEVPVDEFKTRWNIQFLCFSIAVVQLVWARGKRIVNLLPSLSALAQLGTLVMMLGLYFLVLNMLLGVEMPSFVIPLIVTGVVMNLIFAEQNGGNFFVNIAKGFGNFIQIFLKAVSCFADIISYIRLFAVGLAGAMIAQIFNNMAIPVDGFGSFGLAFVLRVVPAVLILVLGHGLNLALTALSIIVHGVRLNLLEYAGNHLEMEWSGYSYNPFALKRK